MKAVKFIFIGLFQFVLFLIIITVTGLILGLLGALLSYIGLSPILKSFSHTFLGYLVPLIPAIASGILVKFISELIFKNDGLYLGYRFFAILVGVFGIYCIIVGWGEVNILADIAYLIMAYAYMRFSIEEKEEYEKENNNKEDSKE